MLSVKYYCIKLNITKLKKIAFKDLLHDVFWVCLVNSTENSCCNTGFISLSTAINNIFSQFYEYVNSS